MKIQQIAVALITALVLFQPVITKAQDSEKAVKPNKELKKVMKDLPADIQLQVLKYAERQKEAYMAAKIKREELKAAVPKTVDMKEAKAALPPQEKEKMAKPAPQKAQELKGQTPSAGSGFNTAPAMQAPAPNQPDYIRVAESMPQTQIEWVEEMFDFGEVKEGTKPTHIYRFKNVGDQPLKITRVKPSCGCTSPSWSKEEIAPGKEGFIEVSYNSQGRPGLANKAVTVTGNFEQRNKVLRFKVNVIK